MARVKTKKREYQLNRAERRRLKSKRAQKDMQIRQEVAIATMRTINDLPFFKRLAFCLSALCKRL